MKLLPRRGADADAAATPVEEAPVVVSDGRKGRPTPKRREAGGGARGPAARPPKNRKEAYKFQKEQTARAKSTPGKPLSREAHREALRKGDPSALPKRDQGPLKALARDYVDSRFMLSNYLLVVFVLLIASTAVSGANPVLGRYLQVATFVLLLTFLLEWYLTGKRLRKVAGERKIPLSGSVMGLGFYAGSRAYLPRRWRLPAPRKARGDDY